MSTTKINPVYTKTTNKTDGESTLNASEWNAISTAVDTAHTKINSIIDDVSAVDSPVQTQTDLNDNTKTHVLVNSVDVMELTAKSKGTNVSLVGNNNVNLEPREAHGTGKDKNDNSGNMKGGNISFKPGDDIELCSHHRGTEKNTEVSVKVMDGEENPVKLQVNAAEITLTTKGKEKTKVKDATGADTNTALYDAPNVMDVNVVTGDGKGYLKVRAQAIDLRCEDHGGVALQPKGYDSQSNMNKIKFEHGGGDGLEFGTFNTEKTSIFTTEYRFKKDGVIKLATRTPVERDANDPKKDANDATTHYTYTKQADDFYDVIDANDPTCTWEDIIKFIAWAKTNNQGPWNL